MQSSGCLRRYWWTTKTLLVDITFDSFFITFAVAVTANMFFVFNISTIVIYSFFRSIWQLNFERFFERVCRINIYNNGVTR